LAALLHKEFNVKPPSQKIGTLSTLKVALKHISAAYKVAVHFAHYFCKTEHYFQKQNNVSYYPVIICFANKTTTYSLWNSFHGFP